MDFQKDLLLDPELIFKSFSGDEDISKDDETGEDVIWVTNSKGQPYPITATAENYLKFENKALGEDKSPVITQDELRRSQAKVKLLHEYHQEVVKREKDPDKQAALEAEYTKELAGLKSKSREGFKPERRAEIVKKRAAAKGVSEEEYTAQMQAQYKQAKAQGQVESPQDTNAAYAESEAGKVAAVLKQSGMADGRLYDAENGLVLMHVLLNKIAKEGKVPPGKVKLDSLARIVGMDEYLATVKEVAKQLSHGNAETERELNYNLIYGLGYVARNIQKGGKLGEFLSANLQDYHNRMFDEYAGDTGDEDPDLDELNLPQFKNPAPDELPEGFSKSEAKRLEGIYRGGDKPGSIQLAHQVTLHSMARIIDSLPEAQRKSALKKIESDFDIKHREGFTGTLNSNSVVRSRNKLVASILAEAVDNKDASANDKVNAILHMAGLLGQIDGANARSDRSIGTSQTRASSPAKTQELWNASATAAGRTRGEGPNIVYDLITPEDRASLLISNTVLQLRGPSQPGGATPQPGAAPAGIPAAGTPAATPKAGGAPPVPNALYSDEHVTQISKSRFKFNDGSFEFDLTYDKKGKATVKGEINGEVIESEPFSLPGEASKRFPAILEQAARLRDGPGVTQESLEEAMRQTQEVAATPLEINSPAPPVENEEVGMLRWLTKAGFAPKESNLEAGVFIANFSVGEKKYNLSSNSDHSGFILRDKSSPKGTPGVPVTDLSSLQKLVQVGSAPKTPATPAPKSAEPAKRIPSPAPASPPKKITARSKPFSLGNKALSEEDEAYREAFETELDNFAKANPEAEVDGNVLKLGGKKIRFVRVPEGVGATYDISPTVTKVLRHKRDSQTIETFIQSALSLTWDKGTETPAVEETTAQETTAQETPAKTPTTTQAPVKKRSASQAPTTTQAPATPAAETPVKKRSARAKDFFEDPADIANKNAPEGVETATDSPEGVKNSSEVVTTPNEVQTTTPEVVTSVTEKAKEGTKKAKGGTKKAKDNPEEAKTATDSPEEVQNVPEQANDSPEQAKGSPEEAAPATTPAPAIATPAPATPALATPAPGATLEEATPAIATPAPATPKNGPEEAFEGNETFHSTLNGLENSDTPVKIVAKNTLAIGGEKFYISTYLGERDPETGNLARGFTVQGLLNKQSIGVNIPATATTKVITEKIGELQGRVQVETGKMAAEKEATVQKDARRHQAVNGGIEAINAELGEHKIENIKDAGDGRGSFEYRGVKFEHKPESIKMTDGEYHRGTSVYGYIGKSKQQVSISVPEESESGEFKLRLREVVAAVDKATGKG